MHHQWIVWIINFLPYPLPLSEPIHRLKIGDIFLIFPRKRDSTIHANCLQWRQFARIIKSGFLGKIRKNISICRLLKSLPRVLSVYRITRYNRIQHGCSETDGMLSFNQIMVNRFAFLFNCDGTEINFLIHDAVPLIFSFGCWYPGFVSRALIVCVCVWYRLPVRIVAAYTTCVCVFLTEMFHSTNIGFTLQTDHYFLNVFTKAKY